ncbi:hypothetical protein CDG76_02595 [Nostoc sp. 'Peltigera membranacea cyanobiont' 210A]|nr:hypothetical protein CDG76_02595 [Nostoc sp. 'Peltigera membranacea cyanobiont' 210A]
MLKTPKTEKHKALRLYINAIKKQAFPHDGKSQFRLNPANSRIFLMLKLIATAARAHISDGINGIAIANLGVSQNSTSSR